MIICMDNFYIDHFFVSLITHIDDQIGCANADDFGQGNFDLVRENSVKSQGILLSKICGNPVFVFAYAKVWFSHDTAQMSTKICHGMNAQKHILPITQDFQTIF